MSGQAEVGNTGASAAHAAEETPRWKRTGQIKADINVTPLVDVVLVLLIIFMVVTPQMEAGISLSLPKVGNPDAAQTDEVAPLTLSVAPDGNTYLEKEQLPVEALKTRLEQLHAERPSMPVVIKADENASYVAVRKLFKLCQQTGFPGASLQVLAEGTKSGGGEHGI